LIWLPSRRFCLCACGVGLSLFSYWFISVAPVRGGHLLLFAGREREARESGSHRKFLSGSPAQSR
jgi:hypothetical protein